MSLLVLGVVCSFLLFVSSVRISSEVSLPPTRLSATVRPHPAAGPSPYQLDKASACSRLTTTSPNLLVGEAKSPVRLRRCPPPSRGSVSSHRRCPCSVPAVDCFSPRLRVNLLSPMSIAKAATVKTQEQKSSSLYSLKSLSQKPEFSAKWSYKESATTGEIAIYGLRTILHEAGLTADESFASFKERAIKHPSSLWERSFIPPSSVTERTLSASPLFSFKEEICGVRPQFLPLLVASTLTDLESLCLSNSTLIESTLQSDTSLAIMLIRCDETHVDFYEILQNCRELKKCFIFIFVICVYHFLSWVVYVNRRVFELVSIVCIFNG